MTVRLPMRNVFPADGIAIDADTTSINTSAVKLMQARTRTEYGALVDVEPKGRLRFGR